MDDMLSSIPPKIQKSRSLTTDHEQFALDIQECAAEGVHLASSFPNSDSQERFSGMLNVPIDINFGLSSSVPTNSFGDQVRWRQIIIICTWIVTWNYFNIHAQAADFNFGT